MNFQISNLYLYKFVFMSALLIAESMFLFRLKKRPYFGLRILFSLLICYGAATVFPIPYYGALYCSFMFMCFFFLTVLTTCFCYELRFREIIFCNIAGYSVQHVASVFTEFLGSFSDSKFNANMYSSRQVSLDIISVLLFVEAYAFVYWCMYRTFGKQIKDEKDLNIKQPILLTLLVCVVFVEIILNSFMIYHKYDYPDFGYAVPISITNIICTVALLIIQFNLLVQKNLQNELEIVYQMWHQEKEQFQISKTTIDLINMKCHDMKHQIHNLSEEHTIDPEALQELENTINIYDSLPKTGNHALDIILAEKSLYCQKNDISISYIIDGKKLNFIRESDIYSLFGNLLDNAIQSTIHLESEKRIISISVRSEGDLVSINSHNYYSGQLQIQDGLPLTTKKDTRFHGFGVKSMVMIVEKYGGNISFSAKNQIFNLNILFPYSAGTPSSK